MATSPAPAPAPVPDILDLRLHQRFDELEVVLCRVLSEDHAFTQAVAKFNARPDRFPSCLVPADWDPAFPPWEAEKDAWTQEDRAELIGLFGDVTSVILGLAGSDAYKNDPEVRVETMTLAESLHGLRLHARKARLV